MKINISNKLILVLLIFACQGCNLNSNKYMQSIELIPKKHNSIETQLKNTFNEGKEKTSIERDNDDLENQILIPLYQINNLKGDNIEIIINKASLKKLEKYLKKEFQLPSHKFNLKKLNFNDNGIINYENEYKECLIPLNKFLETITNEKINIKKVSINKCLKTAINLGLMLGVLIFLLSSGILIGLGISGLIYNEKTNGLLEILLIIIGTICLIPLNKLLKIIGDNKLFRVIATVFLTICCIAVLLGIAGALTSKKDDEKKKKKECYHQRSNFWDDYYRYYYFSSLFNSSNNNNVNIENNQISYKAKDNSEFNIENNQISYKAKDNSEFNIEKMLLGIKVPKTLIRYKENQVVDKINLLEFQGYNWNINHSKNENS